MIHTFAAIYIGSYEVSIKIFEISGKKKIRDIDYIRSRIELGRDAYSKGSIGYELVEALCDTLAEYKKIMDGYRVDSYEAYAAAALRNAENELFILDQILSLIHICMLHFAGHDIVCTHDTDHV